MVSMLIILNLLRQVLQILQKQAKSRTIMKYLHSLMNQLIIIIITNQNQIALGNKYGAHKIIQTQTIAIIKIII